MSSESSATPALARYRFRVRTASGEEVVSQVLELKPRVNTDPHELEFRDAMGKPIDSHVFVEYADGRVEATKVEKGMLRVSGGNANHVKCHFPLLLDARFSESSVDWASGAGPEVEVVLKHAAMPADAEAIFTFSLEHHLDGDDEHPEETALGDLHAKLTAGEKPAAPLETRARWKLAGFSQPGPGESAHLICKVQVGERDIEAGQLEVRGPDAKDSDD